MNNKLVFKIAKRAGIIVLLIVGIFAFISKDPKPIAMGIIFGALISVLNFKLLDNTVSKAMKMGRNRATGYTMVHYLARLVLYFTVLIIATKADYLNLIATIGGLFIVKVTIVGSNILDKDFTKIKADN